jgi:hypothetical protein
MTHSMSRFAVLMLGIIISQQAVAEDAATSDSNLKNVDQAIAAYESMHSLFYSTPTQGGLEIVRRETGSNFVAIDYDINLNLTWVILAYKGQSQHWMPGFKDMFETLVTNSDEQLLVPNAIDSFYGLTLTYISSYDFRLDMYSQPIVSKHQNPQLSIFYEKFHHQNDIWFNVSGGLAHESNGQYMNTDRNAKNWNQVDSTLNDQSFASMGWNYVFGRLSWNILDYQNNHNLPCFLFLEYRQYITGPSSIEDKVNITNIPINQDGITAYDGIRFGFLYHSEAETYGKVQLILPSNFGTRYMPDLANYLARVGLDLTHYFKVLMLPCYAGLHLGTAGSPAYYFSHDYTVSLGFYVPTSYFANYIW